MRRANTPEGDTVIDEMDLYFTIFSECANPRLIGLEAVVADEQTNPEDTMFSFSDADPVQIYDMRTRNQDILESMDDNIPLFLT